MTQESIHRPWASWTEGYVAWVLRHQKVVVGCTIIVTLVAAMQLSRASFGSSVVKLFFGDSPEYAAYRARADIFGENDITIIAFDDDSGWSKQGMARLDRITSGIKQLRGIRDAYSIAGATAIESSGDDLKIERYGQMIGLDAESARRAVEQDDLVAGILVSRDLRSFAVLVELQNDPQRRIEDLPGTIDAIIQQFAKEGYARDELNFAGMIPESVEATSQARDNLYHLFPATLLVLLLVIYGLFRQFWPALLTFMIAAVAITWTFAIAVLWDPEINIMLAMVPGIMVIVAFCDIIHLCSAYLSELRRCGSKQEAIMASCGDVGRACAYTSMTTLFGFAALAFVPTPIFRQLGVVLGCGVGLALFLSVTLVPILFSRMRAPNQTMTSKGRLEDLSVRLLRFATRYPRWVICGFAVVTIVSLVGIAQIKIETNFAQRLSEDNHIRRAHEYLRGKFSGSNILDIYITLSKDVESGDLLDANRFKRIRTYEERIKQLAGVDAVYSLASVFAQLDTHVSSTRNAITGTPTWNRLRLAQYLLLLEMSGSSTEHLIDDERRTMRIIVRLHESGLVQTGRLGDEIVALAHSVLAHDMRVEATGLSYLFGKWIKFIVLGQRNGLMFAFFMTLLMMMLVLGKVRAGAIAMFPNVFPLLAVAGLLGWIWDSVDSDTIMIAIIGIGIAVDDTIHFCSRLRIEVQRCTSLDQALLNTVRFSGKAILQTTVILCLGFLPFATSDYFTTQIFGTLLPLIFVLALAADILLLPALVQLRWLRL